MMSKSNKSKVTVAIFAGVALALLAATLTPAGAQTGTWTALANGFPGTGSTANPAINNNVKGPDTALLLTDGSVIMHDICTPSWFRLLPANSGSFGNSYINGQWSATAINDNAAVAAMIGSGAAPDNYGPLFYASSVLPDGRVILNGGEAENSTAPNRCSTNPAADSTKGSLFDPQTNTWTSVPPPPGWTTIGDSGSILLGANNVTGINSSANYMLQNCCDPAPVGFQAAVAAILPRPGTTVTWTTTSAGKADANNEEGWIRLPNGQVLTVDTHPCNNPGTCTPTAAERFDPSQNLWVSAGNTPTSLVSQNPQGETGPAVSIGYNMAVAFGAVNAIALYQFPNTWKAQTAFSAANQAVPDGPASLLPSGNILVQTSNGFNVPSTFWEFNSSALSPQNTGPVGATQTVNQPQCNSGSPNTTSVAAFQGRMLLLPTGQVLWDAGEGVNCTSIYQSNNNTDPNPVMRPAPHITSISNTTLARGSNGFTLTGSMFRGVSQGASYGDDAQMATDFPLVRITNNTTGNWCWGRTHDWATQVSTQFDVPPAVTPAAGWALVEHSCDPGASTLVVIVNSKVSNAIAVTVN